MAQDAKVKPLMSKDLSEFPGNEALMIMVEYPPGTSDTVYRHHAHGFIYPAKLLVYLVKDKSAPVLVSGEVSLGGAMMSVTKSNDEDMPTLTDKYYETLASHE